MCFAFSSDTYLSNPNSNLVYQSYDNNNIPWFIGVIKNDVKNKIMRIAIFVQLMRKYM